MDRESDNIWIGLAVVAVWVPAILYSVGYTDWAAMGFKAAFVLAFVLGLGYIFHAARG